MLNKPFRPPSLIRKPAELQRPTAGSDTATEPPAKRRRISQDADDSQENIDQPETRRPNTPKPFPRKPLLQIKGQHAVEEAAKPSGDGAEGYYNVLWRKFTTKKNKTWDGDGVLAVYNGYAHLQDVSGRDMGKTMWNAPLLPGSALSIGGKDVEVDSVISKADFLAGRPFLGETKKPTVQELDEAMRPSLKVQAKQVKLEARQVEKVRVAVPASQATRGQFKTPLLSTTVMPKVSNSQAPQPRHDPNAPGALVMKRPKHAPKGKQIVDVVVDPFLCKHLREHQREGVKFMYECVMGLRGYEGEGAILADEMGLGKTLQTIALLWTLLKQNPIYENPPVIKKALVVCPVSLMNNWRKEFRKWLGNERIGVFVADDKKVRLTDFTMGRSYSVMIIGYERLRNVHEDLQKGSGVDIVIIDEGHKLKTQKNKAAQAIKSLNTERRIVLSGTPMQNDLSEFFVMVDFVNPGFLGKSSTFKREFEGPILRSRQPDASAKEIEKGKAREEELASLTGQFMLRRTAEVLAKYLPPKTEYILFCNPTRAQASVYRKVISSPIFSAALGSSETALQLINVLKKVCNSPSLLNSKKENETPGEMLTDLLTSLPPAVLSSPASSTKLRVLDSLLHRIRTTTKEKVVLVSNWTSTLDILEKLLSSLSYPFLRLDGSTTASKRQGLVDRFNNSPASTCFAFLLSAKSGGVGLNLIGASRLVLFDVDWNPATDLQAMARIHRDGQKRHCRIYRLLVKGALDEKIYQRQVSKQGLADAVVDNKSGTASFSREELRDLFSLDERAGCQTHDLLGCECGGRGNVENAVADASDKLAIEEGADGATEVEEDSDDDLPPLGALMPASQVDMEAQERRMREKAAAEAKKAGKGKGKMKALMGYRHVDASYVASTASSKEVAEVDGLQDTETPEPEELVDDEVLLDVLKEEGCAIKFLFSKTAS